MLEKMGEKLRLKVAALLVKDKRILLVRNKGDKGFTLPGGGVERGEDIYDTLSREIEEEIACSLDEVSFFDTYLGAIQEDGRRNFAFVFKVTSQGKPKKGKDVEEVKWFSIKEILAGITGNNGLVKFIRRVKAKLY